VEQSGEEGDVYAMIAYIKSEDKKGKEKKKRGGKNGCFFLERF